MRTSPFPSQDAPVLDGGVATDLIAKVLYERAYGRIWEDATQWARRDSVACAQSIVGALCRAHMLNGPGAAHRPGENAAGSRRIR